MQWNVNLVPKFNEESDRLSMVTSGSFFDTLLFYGLKALSRALLSTGYSRLIVAQSWGGGRLQFWLVLDVGFASSPMKAD